MLAVLRRYFSSSGPLKNEALLRFQAARLLPTAPGTPLPAEPITALLSARPAGHDLILVDSRPTPPIVRFQAHSESFKAALLRQEAQTRARLANKLKELHLSTAMGEHDFLVKAGRAEEWLGKGWRVRVLVEQKKRSRQSKSTELTAKVDERRLVMTKIIEHLNGIGEQCGAVEQERGNLIFTLGPTTKILNRLKQQREQEKENKK